MTENGNPFGRGALKFGLLYKKISARPVFSDAEV